MCNVSTKDIQICLKKRFAVLGLWNIIVLKVFPDLETLIVSTNMSYGAIGIFAQM